MPATFFVVLLLLLTFGLSACSDDSRGRSDQNSDSGHDAAFHDTDPDANADADADEKSDGDTYPDADADAEAESDGDTKTDVEADTTPEPDDDPDGTKYPLKETPGFVRGSFERKEAAFDGVSEQTADESASLSLQSGSRKDFLLGTEWDCAMRIRRIEITAPIDTPFVSNTDSPTDEGKPSTMYLMGKRGATFDQWQAIASREVSADARTITFMPEDLVDIPPHVALGIAFDQDVSGRVHVAEIQVYGYCTTTPIPIEWHASDWWCAAQCQQPGTNPGELARQITCQRDNQYTTDSDICEAKQSKPTDVGGPCQIECPHSLKFIGYRPFSYNNKSGWLHEGNARIPTHRAGPLPPSTHLGTTIEAIQGQPCSVLTPASAPERYFVGISCTQNDENGALITPVSYCAFRCE